MASSPRTEVLVLACPGRFGGVFGGCASDDEPEVADEVGVVVVAEVECELGPWRGTRCGELFGCLVDTEALEDPLGPDAHVAPEEALQGARRDVVHGGEVLDASVGTDLTHALMTSVTSAASGSSTSARGASSASILATTAYSAARAASNSRWFR